MHDYGMLQDGDRVLVAVSGGVDSTVLAWVLQMWRAKAPIKYTLQAVYIDNGFWTPDLGGEPPDRRITAMLQPFGLDIAVVQARQLSEKERTCYLCARNRRSQLFDLAAEWGMSKIALGHHMDDLLETLLLNMLYSGNISTMVPKQSLFNGELQIIRPLAYIEKDDIRTLAELVGMDSVKNYCPLEKDTRRETIRSLLVEMYRREPGAKKSLFHALKNVRHDYLL